MYPHPFLYGDAMYGDAFNICCGNSHNLISLSLRKSLYYYAISLISVPASLRDVLRGVRAEEDVAGVLAESGVLGDEAEVAEVGGVEAAEGDILQAVEVVLRRRAVVATAILKWLIC